MHQVIKAERQQLQQRVFQRDDRSRGEQLLECRIVQFPVEHRQHFLLGGYNIAHNTAVIKQAVIRAVFGVKVDLHRNHKVDRGDQDA